MANSFGSQFIITSFGESHGPSIGVVIDGMPAGIQVDEGFIQSELDKRKPGQSSITTQRSENDIFTIVSGVFKGFTTGAPVTVLIPNTDARPEDYEHLKDIYRPGHADYVYAKKYGSRDFRGGGRSSARITSGWVAAGAFATLYLKQVSEIKVEAIVSSIYDIPLPKPYDRYNWNEAENNAVRCPDEHTAGEMVKLIERIRSEGDSVGGTIACRVQNVPVGLGEPVFNKLNADIARAILSINAVKGIQFGKGFESSRSLGSQNNDTVKNRSNNDGGITGGISNGQPIEFEVAFKPTSSIGLSQSVLTSSGVVEELKITGRHDPCVLPRAVPIVKALTTIVLADQYLMNLKFIKLNDRKMT